MALNVYIKFPIWKTRSVGVNHKFITDDLAIQILYQDEYGKRMWPHVYRISRADALSYPTQRINEKVNLHIIPIADLRIETNDEKEEREYKQLMGIL